MKALRVIGNIVIGIILFGLIFTLTFVRSTKNFLEKDLITGVVKSTIIKAIKEENGEITEKNKELLSSMLEDDESNNIIRIILDNIENYQKNKKDFKVSDSDVEKIYNYAIKYKDTIIEISSDKTKDMSDEEFKKIFSSENINKIANEMYSNMDEDLNDNADIIISSYNWAVSDTAMIVLISSIIFFIILLFLINWSWFKWMIVPGVDLIISGILFSLLYTAGLLFNDIIVSTDLIEGGINFNSYLIWGVSELLIGIILVIIYSVIKNKKDDEQYKALDK